MKKFSILFLATMMIIGCSPKGLGDNNLPLMSNDTHASSLKEASMLSNSSMEYQQLFSDVEKVNDYYISTFGPYIPTKEHEWKQRAEEIMHEDGVAFIQGVKSALTSMDVAAEALAAGSYGALHTLTGTGATLLGAGEAFLTGFGETIAAGVIAYGCYYAGKGSLHAYKKADENGGKENPNDCSGYSVLTSGNFWNHIVFETSIPELDRLYNTTEDNEYTTPKTQLADIGYYHNHSIIEYYENHEEKQLDIAIAELFCNNYDIDTSFTYEIVELTNATNNLSIIDSKEYILYSQISSTYLHLPSDIQKGYYEQMNVLLEKYLDTPANLSALLLGGALNVLRYSSLLWRPFTPDYLAEKYIVVNTNNHSDINIVQAEDLSMFLQEHSNTAYFVCIPAYKNQALDRIYIFEDTPGQSSDALSLLNDNKIFILDEDTQIENHTCVKGGYPMTKNPNGNDFCIILNMN